jgi:hypothetical protein
LVVVDQHVQAEKMAFSVAYKKEGLEVSYLMT